MKETRANHMDYMNKIDQNNNDNNNNKKKEKKRLVSVFLNPSFSVLVFSVFFVDIHACVSLCAPLLQLPLF